MRLLFSLIIVTLFISGCAQKVRIKALTPAAVGEMAENKKVAITEFKKDRVGLSGNIESLLAKHKLDNKRYFTLLSRKDMSKVLREQKLQSSELMDERTSSRVGKIIGAQAIINGEVSLSNAVADSYVEKRTRCLKYVKDVGCVKYQRYYITCNTTEAQLSANINIVDIETGSIIYGDSYAKSYSGDSCGYGTYLTKAQAMSRLSSQISREFVEKLTPRYVYFNVSLLDSIEIDASSEDDDRLEYALEYIKDGRLEKAEKILTTVMDSVEGKSYVVAYDLGVVKEAQGKLDEAKRMYDLADELALEPVEEINIAVGRINRNIYRRDEAKRQLSAE